MANDRCPTCGSPVRVVSSDEGTGHYEPVGAMPPAAVVPGLDDQAVTEVLFRLAALAAQAGDAEALGREFLAAYHDDGNIPGNATVRGAKAVAARVAAQFAAREEVLRDALEEAAEQLAYFEGRYREECDPGWLSPVLAGVREALADPSPAVARMEAEARLGRVYSAWIATFDRRALDGGGQE